MPRVKRVSALRRGRRPATVVVERNRSLAPAPFADSRAAPDPFFDRLPLNRLVGCEALEPRRLAAWRFFTVSCAIASGAAVATGYLSSSSS
jgi:hypothetical protein